MELTKRQALYLIVICLLASKVQRLPSLISTTLARHGYLVYLIMGGIDVLMLLLCLWFNKLAGKKVTTYEVIKKSGGEWLSKIVYSGFAAYFFFNSILPYEAVHDLFANILFDQLSWGLYSLILIVAVFFIASRGLKNLGRLSEVFFYIIILSFITLLILGASTSNLYRTLPICDMAFADIFRTCFKYNIWFGDFVIIYMFVGLTKEDDGKLGLPIVIAIIITTLVMAFAYMVFYGLFKDLSSEQNSLISSISQFSLLDLDIGRVDWFLVLFFQFSTILSSSTYLYLTTRAIYEVFISHKTRILDTEKKNVIKFYSILTVFAVLLYLLDIFIFKSNQEGVAIMAGITQYFGIVVVLVFPIVLLICGFVCAKKRKKQEKTIHNSLNNLSFIKNSQKSMEKPKSVPRKLKAIQQEAKE